MRKLSCNSQDEDARSVQTRRLRVLIVLSGVMIVYGNGIAVLDRYYLPAMWTFPALVSPLVVGLALLWAVRRQGLSMKEMGIGGTGLLTAAAVGAGLGTAMGLVALAFLGLPLLQQDGIRYGLIEGVDVGPLLRRVLVTMPLDTVLVEEVLFRGVLLALCLRAFPATWAVLISSAVFVPWHGVVNHHTLVHTNLAESPALFAIGLAGAYVAVFAGGVIFALLRLRFRNLAAPVAAHWAVNGVILAGMATL